MAWRRRGHDDPISENKLHNHSEVSSMKRKDRRFCTRAAGDGREARPRALREEVQESARMSAGTGSRHAGYRERRGPAEGRLDLPSWGLDGCRKEGEAVVSYSPRSESRLFLQAVTPSTIVKGK